MKLSVIIPIYNVEAYLRKCVDSVLNQDIDDYEIILVDDGSTDTSGTICDEYAHTPYSIHHTPIKVIHQDNAGLSAARNSGIKIANGDYLMFVDSDDYIEPNVLAGLMEQIERDNLDVLRYRLQYVTPQYEVYNPYKSDPFEGNNYSEEPTDGVSFLNTRMSTACYAWAFILRRALIINLTPHPSNVNNVLFTPGIYFEDTDWTPRMLCRAKRVASTSTVVYNYLQREGSITNAVNRSKQKKVLDDKMRLIGEMQRQAHELNEIGEDCRWYRDMIADLVVNIIGILSVDFYTEKDRYIEELKELGVFPFCTRSIKGLLVNISPYLAVNILHIKNRK